MLPARIISSDGSKKEFLPTEGEDSQSIEDEEEVPRLPKTVELSRPQPVHEVRAPSLNALQDAADALEDRMEGIAAE